jgi:signal transduction histidine kinase
MAAAPQPSRRILVIDDNESIHNDLQKLLCGWLFQQSPADALASVILDEKPMDAVLPRFEVDCAFSGETGLTRLREAREEKLPYAVAFVDVRMPGWDGIETTARLWDCDPDLQVILCTAFSDYSWRDLVDRFPACDRLVLLKKPFDAVEALQLAAALSEKWRLEQDAKQHVATLEGTIHDQQHNRALAEAQFSAVLAERNRVAREIHDTLAQGFAAIFVQLEVVQETLNADTETARKHLNRACDLARQSLEQARRTIWNIRPKALETHDLAAALREIGQLLTADTPTEFVLKVEGTPRRLSALIENNLLRIGQEAITNAMKHSRAANIDARLSFTVDSVNLTVSDNGIGEAHPAEPSTSGSGFGLTGMRERAEEMQGDLDIQSTAGHGTQVSVTVPFC